MIKILDWYIAKVIASTTSFCLLILVGLSSMLKFVEQLKSVGQGTYSMLDAASFVMLMVPRDIELFFPMAALLGALIGLGMMATNSELVVMQAAGISKLQVIMSVMKTAIPLMILVMILGEWGAPWAEREARNLRTQEMSGGSLIKNKQGLWAKDGERFVHVTKVLEVGLLHDVTIYQLTADKALEKVTRAKVARFKEQAWQLEDVKETRYTERKTITSDVEKQTWRSTLTPDKLGVVTINKPESLSIQGLREYLAYLKLNKQDTRRYDLAFWRKLVQPLTVAVMMLVALSFVFGPLRSVSMGARLVMGVVTGFAFHLSNAAFGPVSLVYKLPPIMGAILPSLLFLGIATYFLNRRT